MRPHMITYKLILAIQTSKTQLLMNGRLNLESQKFGHLVPEGDSGLFLTSSTIQHLLFSK